MSPLLLVTLSLLAPTAQAFPPAPHHTIYGQVRDEFGNPLATSAEVLLQTGSGAVVRGNLEPGREPGINYSLNIPMDSGLTSDLYRPTALKPTLPFTMRVKIGDTIYLPIEMKGDFKSMGQPGAKTRLDLTLGEDSDNDGLPDAWERALITALGGGLTLADIKAGDDSDGDGMSNLDEYVAGNYAFDPDNGFNLEITRMNGAAPVLKFTVLPNRNYQVLSSQGLNQWTPINFRVGSGELQDNYQSDGVHQLEVEVNPNAVEGLQFYRLVVR